MSKSSVAATESRVVRERGCWWWDSNPQGLAPRDVRGLRVYRFRHTSTSLATTPAIPKAKTRDPTRAAARGPQYQPTRTSPVPRTREPDHKRALLTPGASPGITTAGRGGWEDPRVDETARIR